MHKLIYEISEESQKGGKLTYFGLYLSRNKMKPGEKLNFMLAVKNYTPNELTEIAKVFIQRSDLETSDWKLAAQKEVTIKPGLGEHLYFTFEPEIFAVKREFYNVIESGEYIIHAGFTPYSPQSQSDVVDVYGEEVILSGKTT